jgi:antitoxin (DNA-binding transcriptional repressor) of toxin-antitoxin stability system
MKTVDISQAADSLSEYGRRKWGLTWVLTRRGRPVAAVVPLDDEDYFSMRLASDPRFIATIERARTRYAATGGLSPGNIRRKHELQPKTSRRRAAPRKPRS